MFLYVNWFRPLGQSDSGLRRWFGSDWRWRRFRGNWFGFESLQRFVASVNDFARLGGLRINQGLQLLRRPPFTRTARSATGLLLSPGLLGLMFGSAFNADERGGNSRNLAFAHAIRQ